MDSFLVTDDHHVGHLVMQTLLHRPDDVYQIDAATGETQSKRVARSRVIRLARSLRAAGLRPGDAVVLGGRNHLDVHLPLYAALMNGLPLAGVDVSYKYDELKHLFSIVRPKIVFCEPEAHEDTSKALEDLALEAVVVTFRGGALSLDDFMERYHDPAPEDHFQIASFDVQRVYAWLISTSGTTGRPKVCAISHGALLRTATVFLGLPNDGGEVRPGLNVSPMQWISAYYNAVLLPVHHVKLQSSAPPTPAHVAHIIHRYRPRSMMITPALLARVLKTDCDMTCFDYIAVGGSQVYQHLITALLARVRKDTVIKQAYGQTESAGVYMLPQDDAPLESCGKPLPGYTVKLVDPATSEEITEPHKKGELWVKGPGMTEYYRDPDATAKAFSEDGWLRSGDYMYRDENDNYYFVDRIKMVIKYRCYQIVPSEIEEVLAAHPGVQEACVTSVPHALDGEHVVACVVRRPQRAGAGAAPVSAHEIKQLVLSKLSVHKQLHGGVVFLDKIPLTATHKVARMKVKELALTSPRE